MAAMRHPLLILSLILLIRIPHCQAIFESFCSSEVEVSGMSSTDGNDKFELDLYESKFLPEDTIILSIKQKLPNYGVNEFALRAYDYDGNVIGRFDDQQTRSLDLKYYTCPNGANVIYADLVEGRGYREIPLTWRATGISDNLDEFVFKATIISNGQVFRVQSAPLRRRSPCGVIPHLDQSINIDYCGESQGCLLVSYRCNNDAMCEYTLAWEVLNDNEVKFHIVARAQGFVGVGFSNDEKRGDDQVILCAHAQGYVYVHNMFVGVQTPQYILRSRPTYGLRDANGYSNTSHMVCKFVRTISAPTDALDNIDGRNRDRIDKEKFVNLNTPHYIYPIYSDEYLMTPQGMRIPVQDISIVKNHPVDFHRRIWIKMPSDAGAVLVKIHAILNIIAWILLASAGVMIARYFESIWPAYERRVLVDASGVVTGEQTSRIRPFSYYTILPPIMITVAVLTWIAFFCILFQLHWTWTHGAHHLWHSILGIIVLVCAFFAPIVGIMRPIERSKRYCVWYWIHWLIISLAHCLAIPVIFLGMDNRRLDLWTWCSWVLFGWCIFHFIVQLIFEIHACCFPKQEYELVREKDNFPEKNPDRRAKRGRIPGETWKPALLGIYLFVTLVVVIILILAVIFFQGY